MSAVSVLEDASSLVETILKASDLGRATKKSLSSGILKDFPEKDKGVVLLSIGKAAASMATAAAETLNSLIEGGLVVVPRGITTVPHVSGIEVLESSHPIPDESSLRAALAALEWAHEAKASGLLLLALVSGGGSALVESPLTDYVNLDDIVELNRLLLNSGASISQINTVRRHVSKVKGGRISLEAYPARVLGLYASDVPGDRVEDIASGPTAPDPTTYSDALNVLRLLSLSSCAPANIMRLLNDGINGRLPETLKPYQNEAKASFNYVIATNMDVLKAVAERLRKLSYNVLIITSALQGESREIGRFLSSVALEIIRRGLPIAPPAAVLLGGETTVTVRGHGRGGRNQELALSWALEAYKLGLEPERAALLAIATDGIDGPTDAAGALVTSATAERLYSIGLEPAAYLNNNDSYAALEAAGALIKTGLTGSNLNNVIVLLVR